MDLGQLDRLRKTYGRELGATAVKFGDAKRHRIQMAGCRQNSEAEVHRPAMTCSLACVPTPRRGREWLQARCDGALEIRLGTVGSVWQATTGASKAKQASVVETRVEHHDIRSMSDREAPAFN